MKTVDGVIDYDVEIYGYTTPDPAYVEDTFDLGEVNPIDVISSAIGGSSTGGPPVKFKGITSIGFTRSKDSAASPCQMTVQGRLSPNMKLGAWVIVYSVLRSKNQAKNRLPKFVGQVCNISTSYQSNPATGTLTQSHDITIREWSSSLHSEIRFSPTSFMQALDATSAAGAVQALGVSTGSVKIQDLLQGIGATFNPYEFAEVVLSVAGAMNDVDKSPTVVALKIADKYPEIASGLPDMPKELLEALGVSTTSGIGVQSQTGFSGVSFIGGVLSESFKNDGSWSGLLTKDDFDKYKKSYLKDWEHIPSSYQIASFIQTGSFSAWNLLVSACEPAINECFTDMLFVQDGNKIVAKPTIFLRCKPFLSRYAEDLAKLVYKAEDPQFFSYYDDLPRTEIGSAYIQDLQVTSTITASPNYYQTSISNALTDKKSAQATQIAAGFLYNKNYQKRWGGIPTYPDATYTSVSQSGDVTEYQAAIAAFTTGMSAFDYRTPSATMMLKSPQIPLSVGANVQFKIRKYTIVAHVESITEKAVVTPEGLLISNFSIRLSRMMKVVDNKLKMFELGEAERLLD
jgi:hypothetical protein